MNMKYLRIGLLSLLIGLPSIVTALDKALPQDVDVFERVVVEQVIDSGVTVGAVDGLPQKTQTIKVKVLEGDNKGKTFIVKNDYIILDKGEHAYIRHQINHLDGTEYITISDPYRLDTLLYIFVIFVLLIIFVGGKQGVRGFISLLGSLVLIFYVLVPMIYSGANAVMVSILVASVIIIFGSYVTHGFSRTTTAAVFGMITTVIVTGLAAFYFVHKAHLTGYTSEEVTYLSLDTKGTISMIGLLFGGIMIGLLGVLYDVAIGQAVAVEELCSVGKQLSKKELFKRGMRIGKEHIGALVNTLAIAYVGASLPLILLLQSSTAGVSFIVNSEIFATELIRILIGSIGLVLAVPVTTWIAVTMLYGKVSDASSDHHLHHHH
jgi:uncharacterized membrane protein